MIFKRYIYRPLPSKHPSSFLRIFSFLILLLLLASCRPIEMEDDIKIELDLNVFKTFVSYRFADAETGDLIGKTDGNTVKLSFGGRDAAAVVTQTGERHDEHSSVLGMISVALDPYGRYKMEPGNSVIFNFTAAAPGYSPTRAAIAISKTGTQVCIAGMRKAGTPASKPHQYKVKPGEISSGILPSGFRLMTPGNLFELDFPDSVQFASSSGEMASGPLTLQATRYNKLSDSPAGTNTVMNFLSAGVTLPAILHALSTLDLTLQATTGAISELPGKPIQWRFPVDPEHHSGDSIPAWRYDPSEKIWQPAGYANIILEDTIRFATLPLTRCGLFAAGPITPTRRVTGEVSFTFTKPFNSSSFPGIIILSDGLSGEKLQSIPVDLAHGLNKQLTLDLPSETPTRLTVHPVNSDDEFSAYPTSITINTDQSTFSGSFSLNPLKCRLSGTVHASFPPEYTAYPVPAILQVIDASNSNVLLSISVSITSGSFATDFSLMVKENRPVNIRLVPATLTSDFLSTPAQIREESPCVELGDWHFALDANTCLVAATATLNLLGTPPREAVPVEVHLLRASDRRLIKKMAVSLSQTSTSIEIKATAPKNTPVVILVKPAEQARPFTCEPSEYSWLQPCSSNPSPSFGIKLQYAQLHGKILFTFDPGLEMEEVPLRIITYTKAFDVQLSSRDYTVRRADPFIEINQFTRAEPLYLKITRSVSTARFSPIPFKIDIPDPSNTPPAWQVVLKPTVLLPVHFRVKVVCPGGEVLPTVQGYYRVPGDDWREMNIISGDLTINIELGLTYEVGMILGGQMIDSTFTVDKQENVLNFALSPEDCQKMGWGG
jgi:hypothetical protein